MILNSRETSYQSSGWDRIKSERGQGGANGWIGGVLGGVGRSVFLVGCCGAEAAAAACRQCLRGPGSARTSDPLEVMVSLVGGGHLPTTPRATETSVVRADDSTSRPKRTSSGAGR